ncbi:uncharacterized protein EI90DRAFT_1734045 [Cantharellus anzutake]|uniref:uncharacterized protein n=1 Tax=Cantharellus anzutake TaxID=1750568 RepID=UPI0019055A65|nr:uncharacterized protein EI90DRAFT_1734045 [Cantharellus anzutake]KAF8341402.1 hypothetical protein EI90DRAFT_1734045 [Cantharellus anzutake]
MRFSLLSTFVALFFSIRAFAAPTNGTLPPACGSHVESSKLQTLATEFAGFEAAYKEIISKRAEEGEPEERGDGFALKFVNVYWHAITAGGAQTPSYATIYAQIARLNTEFRAVGYYFRLVKIDYTANPTWYDLGQVTGPNAVAMKTQLRKGGVRDLNVYSVNSAVDGTANLAGYSSFPWDYNANPKLDGIVIILGALTGSHAYSDYFILGRTLVHETGHWVGLLHPFSGGCTFPNDYVSDTPEEASPAYYCPTGRDTCPGGGPDPIHNFMDYTQDTCRWQFTPGQIWRARIITWIYRGIWPFW